MTFTEAFGRYGATLRNPKWSISALAPDGAIVVSLYENWFKKGTRPRTLVYADRLSAWKGNESGRNEFRRLLEDGLARSAVVRVVLAHPHPNQAHLVGQVADESVIRKTFSVREDWVGAIAAFDGDEYRIVVEKM